MPMATRFVDFQKTYERIQLLKLHDLWLIMKNETLSSKKCCDEKVQEMAAITGLFERRMLLIGQTFLFNFLLSQEKYTHRPAKDIK